MMTRLTRLFLLAVLLCLPTLAHATIFWDDEMEQGSTGFSEAYMLGTLIPQGTMAYDTSVKMSGTGSVRLNYPSNCQATGTTGQCGGSITRQFPPSDDVYKRVYFRMSGAGPNVTASGVFETSISAFTKMLNGLSTTSPNGGYSRHWWSMGCCTSKRFLLGVERSPTPTSSINVFSSVTFADDRWYCIRTREKMNTATLVDGVWTYQADGIAQAWVDDVLVLDKTDALWRNSGVTDASKWFQFQLFRQNGAGNIWFDRFAAGDEPIPCIGSVPDGDTTNPAPPTSPAVTASGTSNSFSWINGSDDVALSGAAVEGCTGVSCVPTPLATVSASVNGSVGSYLDTNIQPGTVYGYRVKNFDTSSNQSTYTTTVYITTAASFRTTAATDNFNRANNADLGSSWDAGYGADDPLTLQSNRVTSTNVVPESTETYAASPALANDQWAQVVLPDTVGTGAGGTLTVNHLTSSVNGTDSSSYTTASITPTANACVLVAVTNRLSTNPPGGPNTPTLTGNGLTYVPILSRTSGITAGSSSGNRSTLYRAMGASPTAGPITIDLAGQIAGHVAWSVTEFQGADTSGTDCSGAIVQSNSTNYAIAGGGAVSPATVTLGSVPASSDNITFAWVRTSSNNAMTVGSGFTQLSQAGDATDGARYLAEYKLNEQTASATFPNAQWVIGAVEIRPASSSASASILLRHANAPTKTGYECRALMPSTTQGVEITAGVRATQSTASTWTWESGDILRGEVEGTTIRCYGIRGSTETLITSFTDATIASGKAGLTSEMMPMDDWAVGEFQAVAPPSPSVTSLILDPAGANVTFDPTRPTATQVRVTFGSNAVQFEQTVIEPISAFTGGRYNRAWIPGLNYACFVAIDSLGNENNALQEYQCGNLTPHVLPLDQSPAILTSPFPTSILPAGTTAADIGFTVNKPVACRVNLTDVDYSIMTIPMTVSNLTASANITGLTNGLSQLYYYRCLFTNPFGEEYQNPASGTITLQVDTVTADTTLPDDVTNVVANPIQNSSSVSIVFDETGDDVAIDHYEIHKSIDNETYVFSGSTTDSPTIQSGLAPHTLYYFKMKGVDTSGNRSFNFSNVAPVTTLSAPDIVPPSQLRFKEIVPASNSAEVEWNIGSDDRGSVTSQIEYCAGALCSDFIFSTPKLSSLETVLSLVPGTFHRIRGRHFDQAGNPGPYSDVSEFTTLAAPTAETASVGVCNCRNKHDARH